MSNKTEKYMMRYNLGKVAIKNIDLKVTYFQYHPEYDEIDLSMINSPHYELAKLYYDHGGIWLRRNFNKTRYFLWKSKTAGKEVSFSKKRIFLFDSIKKGYLAGGNRKNYIVVLDKPLIESRYDVSNIKLNSPEVFMGHHRIGALLALGIDRVRVIIAKDNTPGICKCYGKIHNIYNKIAKGD